MKTGITILTLLITTAVSAQFDRIITTPITENPSYVGSTGSKRIIAHGSLQKMKHQQLISYDFFSNKLKGGWGIELSNNKLFEINEAILRVAYSPKISPWNKGVTWAPGISLLYSNIYQESYHPDFVRQTDYETEHYENAKNNTFQISVALTRNSKKSLSSIIFRYDPTEQIFENELAYFIKLDNIKSNKLSSTIAFRNHFLSRSNKNTLTIGTHLSYNFSPNSEDLVRVPHPITQEKLGVTYALKLNNLKLDLNAQLVLWAKSILHQNIEYVTTKNYRELSYLDSENKVQATLSYKINKLTLFAQGTYGFIKPTKVKFTTGSIDNSIPVESEEKFMTFQYYRTTTGASFNF